MTTFRMQRINKQIQREVSLLLELRIKNETAKKAKTVRAKKAAPKKAAAPKKKRAKRAAPKAVAPAPMPEPEPAPAPSDDMGGYKPFSDSNDNSGT